MRSSIMKRSAISIACTLCVVSGTRQAFALGLGACVGGLDPFTGFAVGLDGINDFVNVPNSASLQFGQQLTVEVWFLAYGGSSVMKSIVGKVDGRLFTSDR